METTNDVTRQFNKIVLVDVKIALSEAFIHLGYNLKDTAQEDRKILLIKKANQAKNIINAYIDSLVEFVELDSEGLG